MPGQPLPSFRLICPKCKWVTFRIYKDEEGFGKCKDCGEAMIKAIPVRHIVQRNSK